MTQPHVETAQTILTQIGRGRSNALRVMTGAKAFMAHDEQRGSLSFKLPNNARDGINYCKVTLTASDTYTVEFGRVHGKSYKVKSTHDDIYCDVLADLFERVTGLYVSF
jgi:hypothetical protein